MALVRIRLADSDRERYDLPEWLEFDLFRPMLSEVKLLKQQTGLTWTQLQQLSNAYDYEGLGLVLWLAVRRAGHAIEWADFDADLAGADTEEVDDDPNSSAPDGAKTSSTKSPRTSRASTGSSRGKSSGSPSRSSAAS